MSIKKIIPFYQKIRYDMIIGEFKIKDCGLYTVYFDKGQIYFGLKPISDWLIKEYGKVWILYVDDEITDDVGINKQPFLTIQKLLDIISHHIKIQKIRYFYFKSSTERKNKIYEHYCQKLVNRLGNRFTYTYHLDGFYFWQEK